jgi:hypothetical protein
MAVLVGLSFFTSREESIWCLVLLGLSFFASCEESIRLVGQAFLPAADFSRPALHASTMGRLKPAAGKNACPTKTAER